ncbi:MAG: hypothetical protein WA631_02975, partial [Nitrososphaeraceae archaeon]
IRKLFCVSLFGLLDCYIQEDNFGIDSSKVFLFPNFFSAVKFEKIWRTSTEVTIIRSILGWRTIQAQLEPQKLLI